MAKLAGTWYDADPEALRRGIRGFMESATNAALPDAQALILPHAGYRYSGATAAYGLRAIAGRSFTRVIVMGPSHRVPLRNIASLPAVTSVRTPLGEVPLDTDFISALLAHSCFQRVPAAHDREHSVEIEVPLLQVALGAFSLVPIVVGQLDLPSVRRMTDILLSLIDPGTLVVASTDFTHFGPSFDYEPFHEDIEENLRVLDMGAADLISARDLEGFTKYCDDTEITMCGRNPVAILLGMLRGDAEVHLLHYDTSGRILGDFTNSVSYVSMAVCGRWPARSAPEGAAPGLILSDADRAELLRLARAAVTFHLAHRRPPRPDELGALLSPGLRAGGAAFVTLKTADGELRGCIGDVSPVRPLVESVIGNAIDAASSDTRFTPVTAAELPALHLEISVLTPPRPVSSPRDIVLGKHGVVLTKQGRRALFLPQVAPEQDWDLGQMLSHLSRKAGLPADAWKSGTEFRVFEAIIFGETTHG